MIRTLMSVCTVGLCVAMSMSGCVSSQMMPVGGQTFPPRPDGYLIDVYLPQEAPVVVHQEVPNVRPLSQLASSAKVIGRVDTQGAPAAGWASLFEDAKRRARELGGDALVVRQWGHHLVSADAYGAQHGKSLSMDVVRLNP